MKTVNFFNAFIVCLGLMMPYIGTAQPIKGSSSNQDAGGTAGVLGTSQIFNGVLGYTTANGHAGVAGACDEGIGNGVYGRSKNKNGIEGWSAANAHSAVVGTNTGGGNGVLGVSNAGLGVHGISEENSAIYGISKNKNGVEGWSAANAHSAVVGTNTGGGNGVLGVSNTGMGVYGIARGRDHGGVVGVGENIGIYGISKAPNGTAGLFDGNVRINGNLSVNNVDMLSLVRRIEQLERQLQNNTIPVGTRKTICADMNNPDGTTIPEGWIRIGRTNSNDCQKQIGREFNAFIIEKI